MCSDVSSGEADVAAFRRARTFAVELPIAEGAFCVGKSPAHLSRTLCGCALSPGVRLVYNYELSFHKHCDASRSSLVAFPRSISIKNEDEELSW
jgi:hypothetical protein